MGYVINTGDVHAQILAFFRSRQTDQALCKRRDYLFELRIKKLSLFVGYRTEKNAGMSLGKSGIFI
jgi:hypothetical protein